MTKAQSALLIGKITHARKEWEALSSLLQLKVCTRMRTSTKLLVVLTMLQGIRIWFSGGLHLTMQEWRIRRCDWHLPIQRLDKCDWTFRQRADTSTTEELEVHYT